MSVRLEFIAFNHDPGSATGDAFNVRVDADTFAVVPEWRRGISVGPADSVAAYALGPTRGNRITIRAAFTRLVSDLDAVEIRAVAAGPRPETPPWAAFLLSLVARWHPQYYAAYYYYLWHFSVLDALGQSGTHVLGDLLPRHVQFGADGRSASEEFELGSPDLWSRGVGTHTVGWRWEFRRSATSPWTAFETTYHRVFTVLDVPNDPWQQQPYTPANTQLPWTDVLSVACRWADGASDPTTAAERLTGAVNRLGGSVFQYGCPIGGLTQYTSVLGPYFDCTAFLDRVLGGIGHGPYINCSDCAAVVSTFANALGADLWQSRMGSGFTFELNPVLAIGSQFWRPACGWPGFDMHEVAWEFPCGERERVFDASLQVDIDPVPGLAPHTPELPANVAFGSAGAGLYLDHLVTPRGRPFCRPQPWTRQRRLVI